MKRLLTAAVCSFFGWVVGIQFNSWLAITGVVVGFLSGLIFENLQETKEILSEIWGAVMTKKTVVLLLPCIWLFLLFISWLLVSIYFNVHYGDRYIWTLTYITICILSFSIFAGFSVIYLLGHCLDDIPDDKIKKYSKETFQMFVFFNPVLFYFTALATLGIGLYKLIPKLPKVVRFCFYFVLALVEREKTLTFGLCTAIGTAIGLLLGKLLICGLIGAVLASGLVFVADKTSAWASQKLQMLKTA